MDVALAIAQDMHIPGYIHQVEGLFDQQVFGYGIRDMVKDLTSQVSAETDPVSLLAKVVHDKALQAPGRVIFVAVSRLKLGSMLLDKLDDSAYKILMDYHSATVTLLALMSAATGDDEDCTSDRILSKKELLEGLMPALKGLIMSTSQS
ncbi:hypothetical protein LOK49_LG08G00423 [Camellia lanceoleosa]|uniref:Uncharacterized protein n=1 Tax=Camellia lanceoleosa TaxID=1840588 RepID=A0ACC0GP44_9ERIC|nr:hypothetical protein LOK49_LG08G00423 [Camellia lanceoleosa]